MKRSLSVANEAGHDITPRASVLRLITRLNIGGPAIQALLLTRVLAEDYPTILATGTVAPDEGELSDPRVEVRRVPLVRPIRPRVDLAAFRAVRHLIDRSQVSLVHTHMAKAGMVGRLAARRSRRPVKTVHTFHGHVLDGYFSRPVERSFIAIERRLAARTDALIAVSDEVRESLLELGIGDEKRFHVIPLGFDLTPFLSVDGHEGGLRRDLGISDEVPLVACIGRLVAIKDNITLLRAMVRVPQAHLVIIGDGDRRSEIERSIVELGLSDRVHMQGWRTDVASCLADIDVIALTSRNEGTPVSLIEASAAGKPVVATDVGGVRSVVVNGVTGSLVPAGAHEDLGARISAILSDPSMAASFGAAGREHVRDKFDRRRLIEDIRGLYSSLLSGSS